MIDQRALKNFQESAKAVGYQTAMNDVLMVITAYSEERPEFARNHAGHLLELLKELLALKEEKCSQSLS